MPDSRRPQPVAAQEFRPALQTVPARALITGPAVGGEIPRLAPVLTARVRLPVVLDYNLRHSFNRLLRRAQNRGPVCECLSCLGADPADLVRLVVAAIRP